MWISYVMIKLCEFHYMPNLHIMIIRWTEGVSQSPCLYSATFPFVSWLVQTQRTAWWPDCCADCRWQGHCWPEGQESVGMAMGKGHHRSPVSIIMWHCDERAAENNKEMKQLQKCCINKWWFDLLNIMRAFEQSRQRCAQISHFINSRGGKKIIYTLVCSALQIDYEWQKKKKQFYRILPEWVERNVPFSAFA